MENSVCIASTSSPVYSLKAATQLELIVGGRPDALDAIIPAIDKMKQLLKYK